MIPIEKNVPIPSVSGKVKYPFGTMQIGDSFCVEKSLRATVNATAQYHANKHGVKFTVRADGDYVRVWRIA